MLECAWVLTPSTEGIASGSGFGTYEVVSEWAGEGGKWEAYGGGD